MHGIRMEVLLAAGYAIFLALVAGALELLARHSHERTRRIRTVGFSYHAEQDVWRCPNDKELYRLPQVGESAVVQYRAPAYHCNNCQMKIGCTDSDSGRLVEVHPDSWVQSELRRFHRGLSLALLLLASLILAAMLVTQRRVEDRLLLATVFLGISVIGCRLAWSFFRVRQTDMTFDVIDDSAVRNGREA